MLDRRSFLSSTAAAVPLICSVGGKTYDVSTAREVDEADAAAAKVPRPEAKPAQSEFPTPEPAPGGQVREYWIQARSKRWDIAPQKVDEWMKNRITGRTTFRAFVYQLMSAGFAEPLSKPRMPGPVLEAEVGDLLVVHFRNADTRLNQAVTMHPHGVKYNPEYDGSYLGDYTPFFLRSCRRCRAAVHDRRRGGRGRFAQGPRPCRRGRRGREAPEVRGSGGRAADPAAAWRHPP